MRRDVPTFGAVLILYKAVTSVVHDLDSPEPSGSSVSAFIYLHNAIQHLLGSHEAYGTLFRANEAIRNGR